MGRSYRARLTQIVRRKTVRRWFLGFFTVGFLFWYFSVPTQLFQKPTSSVLEDANGGLLAARIAEDGQWRFPEVDSVPTTFKKCLLAFEDRTFYDHYGFRLSSFARAFWQNIKAKKVVSGGSTLTMQTIRLSRENPSRTVFEKLLEVVAATRLEFRYSKEEILALYASHAPFGGNVVGLEAAAWRYYNRSPHQLSWAEAATLAVLPNAPSLIFPGKNATRLQEKRNRVLTYLYQENTIDSLTYQLAIQEPLPGKPHALPQQALPLLNHLEKQNGKGKRFRTTLNRSWQNRVQRILNEGHQQLKGNQIHNAAALVVDINSGKVVSYCGNVNSSSKTHGSLNDMVHTPRSTGSILKPFLYAAALDDGVITPYSLLADIPTNYGGYAPKNYDLSYSGAVPAHQALARSLNVPSVRLLKEYGTEKFHHQLKQLGISTLNQPANHYGLSIILGGSEATMWDLASIYRRLALQVKAYPQDTLAHEIYVIDEKHHSSSFPAVFSVGSVHKMFEAMLEVVRPTNESMWQYFENSENIAWKTGTSFGYRDAWAVGVSGDYVVAVWVGNANGEGRPGLTGIEAAAPLLFRIFDGLPKSKWLPIPYDDLVETELCAHSGAIKGVDCAKTVKEWIPRQAHPVVPCDYCTTVLVDATQNYRVNRNCDPTGVVKHWFVLPPIMEWFYKKKHPEYVRLPPFRPDCSQDLLTFPMRLIYPKKNSELYVPVNFEGEEEKIVFEASHRNENETIYWHLNDNLVATTTEIHQVALSPSVGTHLLTLMDASGNEFSQWIEIKKRGL